MDSFLSPGSWHLFGMELSDHLALSNYSPLLCFASIMCESSWTDDVTLLCCNTNLHVSIQRHIWDILYYLLFIYYMYSQTMLSLHVGVQDQTSIKRQCIRCLGAKGSSSPCPHKHAVKFPASHFKTSTTLQPFAHCPRYFLAFYWHEFGFLWPFK